MGCAPSIHVSQSGVFYCREGDIREGSSPRPRESSASEIVGHIRSSSDSGSHLSSTSSSRVRAGNIKKGYSSQRGSSIDVETQTQYLKMERSKVRGSYCCLTLCLLSRSHCPVVCWLLARVCYFPRLTEVLFLFLCRGNIAGWYEGVNAGSYEVVSTTNAGIKIFVLRKYTADSYLVIAHHRDLLVLKGSFPGFSLKTTLIFP